MNLLRKIIVLLNAKPFTYVFAAIYAFGLRRLLAALGRNKAVRSVFGSGSFFEGRCLYGLSDIDLIIVFDERYSRADPEPHEVAFAYNRVRRLFPFLGTWEEKAENLIFLSEVRAGFPLPESFRLRAKQKRLFLLCGDQCLEEFLHGPVSLNEILSEVDTLLRMTLAKKEVHTDNLLFWKKIFSKLTALADAADLSDLAGEMRTNPGLSVLNGKDTTLFLRRSDPDALFPLLLEYATRLFKQIQEREETTRLNLGAVVDSARETVAEPTFSKALAAIRENVAGTLSAVHGPLLGILPRLNYCPIDREIAVIELERAGYREIRSIVELLAKHGEISESLLVRADGFLFVLSKQPAYVDIVPLDPLIYASVYARLLRGERSFEMPAAIYNEQKAMADGMSAAMAGVYRKNEGWIAKLPFPCFYLEDDVTVIRDAFHRMRVTLIHTDAVDIDAADGLVRYLGEKHPACRQFLNDLLASYRALTSNGRQADAGGNNLYRCLHQFMAQLLDGAPTISLDDHRRHVGITVGIITRNRASDLREMLDSLGSQERPPDEVLIVDNGSTDNTREVAESFHDRLPISYRLLPDASIPNARNMVIENARQEIVAFTDDDCIAEPGWLASVERGFLRAENVGIVGGWVKHEWTNRESMIDTYYSLFHHAES
jgi:hypothetical protein